MIDEWHDILRLILGLSCCITLAILIKRFRKNGKSWNVKTKDYWYSLVMWCAAGISFGIEGVIRDRPLGPTLVLVFAASIVSIKGALKKGTWGDNTA